MVFDGAKARAPEPFPAVSGAGPETGERDGKSLTIACECGEIDGDGRALLRFRGAPARAKARCPIRWF